MEQRHCEPSAKRARRIKDESLLEFNDCFILKQALAFLGASLADIGKIMLVCRSWRNVAVTCEHLWTLLLLQRYPNLKEAQLETGNDRNAFLRRLQLDCDPGAPVRKQAWPSALRTPPARLIEMWKPKSILFLVDVHINSVRVASESHRVQLEKGGSDGKLLVPVTKKKTSSLDDEESSSSDSSSDWESDEEVDEEDTRFITMRMDDLQGDVANAAESLANDRNATCKVLLSFQLEGDLVPPHRPIVLLSEHEWTMISWHNRYSFQTDVSGMLSEDNHDHYLSYAQKKAADEKKKRDICRYDTSPLPFDPVVEVCVSPQGSVNSRGGIRGNDSSKECLLEIGIDFNMFVSHFPAKIFPTLLSLCEDATR